MNFFVSFIQTKTKKLKAKLVGIKRKAEDSPQNVAKKKKLGRPPLSANMSSAASGGGASAKPSPPDSGISTPVVEKVNLDFCLSMTLH